MQLVIDIGNTRVKAAVFENTQLLEQLAFKNTDDFLSSELLKKFAIKNCILSTVVNGKEDFVAILKAQFPVLTYTIETPTPVKNKYESPHTLGSDRLAAAVGGNFMFPDKNLLIIDAGTCIKYNFVSQQNEFIGGAISPGLKMRFKALHSFTSRLPLLELDAQFNTLIASNTNNNLLAGVQMGALAEMKGFIEQYKSIYPDIQVILTGGDINFFENRLKTPIFADPFLILKGLNIILNYNH